jgi:hypothetical protein
MSEIVEIYGAKVRLPGQPPESEMINFGLPRERQKWKKKDLPDFFDKVEINKAGDLLLTPQQEAYATEEVARCRQGVWAMVGGKPRYFTGKYYFFLQYYTLEDGIPPDFREEDRLYFLFHHHWHKVEWCLGNIRTKKRRQGASSQSCSNILYEAIFYKNSNCGLLSKTKDDSKDTFTQMVTFAYRQLPIFLKPKQVNKEDSVTELIFAHKSTSTKEGVVSAIKSDEGHGSRINYKAPVLNAFDRGRMNFVLVDEGGKLPKDVPVSQLLAIISKTLVKGVKRVGWVDLPSTTNEMLKGGGMEFYKIWKAADQFKRTPTINRIVRFFQPAYLAYEGFIDAYGDSVVDAPTQEQYEYLVSKWVKRDPDSGEITSELSEEDIKLGARHYVQVKRRIGLEGMDLEEEMRMNPCNEEEAFMSAVSDCVFDSLAIKKRQKELEENPVFKRRVLFHRNLETQKVEARTVDERDTFHWRLTQLPPSGQENKFTVESGLHRPGRIDDGAISVDSYSNSQGGRKYGSKASAWIGRRFDILQPDTTGKPIGHLYGRPKEKDDLHNQVMLAAEYFGYQAYYEHTADDYLGFFRDRGRQLYLGIYPVTLIDPTKREGADRFKGVPITPFSLTKQLDNGIAYFIHYCHLIDFEELLDNALIFDAYDRTAYDTVVSFLILVSVLMEPVKRDISPPTPLIKTYPAIANSQNN